MLGEGPNDGIKGSAGTAVQKFSINFTKAKTKLCFSLHDNVNNSYLFITGEEILEV